MTGSVCYVCLTLVRSWMCSQFCYLSRDSAIVTCLRIDCECPRISDMDRSHSWEADDQSPAPSNTSVHFSIQKSPLLDLVVVLVHLTVFFFFFLFFLDHDQFLAPSWHLWHKYYCLLGYDVIQYVKTLPTFRATCCLHIQSKKVQRQNVPPKHRYWSTRLYGVSS